MSRRIRQVEGKVFETISSMDECLYKWNNVCCNDSSIAFAMPIDSYCEVCQSFTKEDGRIDPDRREI